MDDKIERKLYHAQKHKDNARKANRDAFVRAALGTAQGRDYFFWLLSLCRVGQQPFTSNALATGFNCGELNVGLAVQAHLIEVTPDGWLSMLKEKEEERLNAERDRNGVSSASDEFGDNASGS